VLSTKSKSPDPPYLFGRKRCLFSHLNLVCTNDQYKIPLIDLVHARHNYLRSHCSPIPDLPDSPFRLAYLSLSTLKFCHISLLSDYASPIQPFLLRQYPFIRYLALPIHPMPLVQDPAPPAYIFTTAIAHDFSQTTKKYASY